MKVLLTGSTGQLGRSLVEVLSPLADVIGTTRNELDLSLPDKIGEMVDQIRPDVIVNAAAYTQVDNAETEPDLARRVNADAPGLLGSAAGRIGAAVLHFSTEYIFDGESPRPYREDDEPNPQNVYGKTKLAGEQALGNSGAPYLIFRVSWLYSATGNNFFKTILKLSQERERLEVVEDQIGAPTSTDVVANAVATILGQCGNSQHDIFSKKGGLYHLACLGSTSWKGFAEEIVRGEKSAGMPVKTREIRGITSEQYPSPVRRPKNSRLDTSLIQGKFGLRLADWKSTVSDVFEGLYKL